MTDLRPFAGFVFNLKRFKLMLKRVCHRLGEKIGGWPVDSSDNYYVCFELILF